MLHCLLLLLIHSCEPSVFHIDDALRKNDDAGLVLPQFYALGIISFATIVNSKNIIAKELDFPESNSIPDKIPR